MVVTNGMIVKNNKKNKSGGKSQNTDNNYTGKKTKTMANLMKKQMYREKWVTILQGANH
jgi:hypothetical protein